MKELKDQLSDLIENNKIDQAIKILKEESAKRGGSLDHIIISLSSRYKRYREKSLMGLEARDQEFTKIVSDTLELVSALDDPSQILQSEDASPQLRKEVSYSKPAPSQGGQPDKSKYIQMGIGGLAVVGLIAIIGIFMGGEETATDAGYEETYYEDAGTDDGTDAAYSVYDVSGQWHEVAQSFGPENDCTGCGIEVSQSGNTISVYSEFWSADLNFNSQTATFDGFLSRGEFSTENPQQTRAYLDANSYLIIETIIQGYQGSMTYSK
jgi:hypothetical protein